MLAKTIRYPFNSLIISLFLHAVNPLTPRINVVWNKKKRLEDPKFISSMQKGAILRKCVNTFVPHCS